MKEDQCFLSAITIKQLSSSLLRKERESSIYSYHDLIFGGSVLKEPLVCIIL